MVALHYVTSWVGLCIYNRRIAITLRSLHENAARCTIMYNSFLPLFVSNDIFHWSSGKFVMFNDIHVLD